MYSISMLIQSQPIQIEPFRFFAGTLLPHVSVMTSPRRMVMLSLRVTMIVVMQLTKRNRVERMMVPSILPPPNNIYPASPSFVATTILLFYYLMVVIGVPSKVLVGDTSRLVWNPSTSMPPITQRTTAQPMFLARSTS